MSDISANEDFIPIGPPFIGGAERARRNARKRKFQPRSKKSDGGGVLAPHRPHNEPLLPYPKSMREYDRFFGSLLSSSTMDIQQSETNGNSHRAVIQQACSLMNIPCLPPPPHLQQQVDARTHHLMQRSSSADINSIHMNASPRSGTYDNARSYYMSLAPLILEESRCIIAEALTKLSCSERSADNFMLELTSIEEKYTKLATSQKKYAPLILNFRIYTTKSKQSLYSDSTNAKWTRPGSVILLRRKCTDRKESTSSILACIVPNGGQQSASSSSINTTISLMVFRREDVEIRQHSVDNDEEENPFYATPITTLISQVRQMEACLRMVKVSFLQKLLGQKSATHIRFDNSSDDEDEDSAEIVVCDVDNDGDDGGVFQEGYYVENDDVESSVEDDDNDNGSYDCDTNLAGLLTKIPILNKTQERAAELFLRSPPESLILVQGPPGTGKSTFLVNVICRRLASNPRSRTLVTAPTNKAVTVIAERFLDVVTSSDLLHKCNAVLIGVEDKLMNQSSCRKEDSSSTAEDIPPSLRSIFVYTWVDSLKTECLSILACLKSLCNINMEASRDKPDRSLDVLVARVENMESKISMSIPSSRSVCTCAKLLRRQIGEVGAADFWNSSIQDTNLQNRVSVAPMLEKAIYHAEELVEVLDNIDSPIPELLATAQVIFCTLSSAGSSLLKQTRGIDDLLIDEAAAATEAEICIPFHLRPLRMLAVGDPLQLPPTIMSRFAANMGLSTSLHERLMNQCSAEYVMLDCQYRMHTQISQFPCSQFYNSRITDGKNVSCKSHVSEVALPAMKPFSFINIRGNEFMHSGGSYANEEECMVVLNLVQKIAARKVAGWDSTDKLRIITFYNGQVALLRHLLSKRGYGKVMVATVDSSQGCEADVVIISFVRSSSKKGVRHAAGFLSDDRRINVALTRARHQLICVGDAHGTLSQQGSAALKNLVAHAKRRGSLII